MRQQVTINNLLYKKLSMLFIVFFMTVIVSAQKSKPYTKPSADYTHSNKARVISINNDNSNNVNENFYVIKGSTDGNWMGRVKFEVQHEGAVGTRHGMFTDWGHLYLVANWDNNVRTEDIVFGFGSNERSKIRERMRLTDPGNLGIGTQHPKERLHVEGNIFTTKDFRLYGKIRDNGPMEFLADDDYSGDRTYRFKGFDNREKKKGTSDYVVFDTKNERNTIKGKTLFSDDVLAAKDFTVGKNFNFIGNINFNDPSTTQQMNVTSGLQISLKNSNANNTFKIGSVAGANALYVANNGKIGMGTDTPSEKLQVDGKVKASGFVADASAFPDYVFANDYELTPLNEVKEFVTTHKHLPNMPSEKEVITNGLDLKKVTTVSVEKIEELYLYTIKQQELIEKLTKRIEQLENNQK